MSTSRSTVQLARTDANRSCCASARQNVGDTERVVSVLLGGALAVGGLARGSAGGLVEAGIGAALVYRGFTGHCQLYQALGINRAANFRPSGSAEDAAGTVPAGYGFKFEKSFVVKRPPQELFDFWRDFENLPSIMPHLQSVMNLGNDRSRWVASGPVGTTVEWDAEVYNEEPGRLIAWRSLPGGDVDTAGSIHFDEHPNGRETEVRVSLKYNPPGGQIGAHIAWLFGSGVEQEIEEDMRRFKRFMEAGEYPMILGDTGRERW